ncbi:hypothetical protein MASR2M15_12090 [Anaerolineales bacterium]
MKKLMLFGGMLVLMFVSMLFGMTLATVSPSFLQDQTTPTIILTEMPTIIASPSETLPPNTPLVQASATRTLLPPPTFEPPTATFLPSLTPTLTATATIFVDVQIEGLRGLTTATATPECTPQKDWQTTYEIQRGDTWIGIADRYGLWWEELVEGNCADPNVLIAGQSLKVPGVLDPAYACPAWELLTPIELAYDIDGNSTIVFNWRGPQAYRNLVRIINPAGEVYELVVDLRQNASLNLTKDEKLHPGGNYTWYVYPLDINFVQTACKEGGPWHFHKRETDLSLGASSGSLPNSP